MALIPVFASLLYYGYFGWALVVFFFAGVSDGFDGYIARKFNQESTLGTILDPIADKLLMTVAFLMMSMPDIMPKVNHLRIPFWVMAAVIGRDILIVSVAVAIIILTDFRGFKPSYPGKLSTLVQVFTIVAVLVSVNFPGWHGYYLPTTYVLVTAMAFFSGIHYIFHVAKLMNQPKPAESKQ